MKQAALSETLGWRDRLVPRSQRFDVNLWTRVSQISNGSLQAHLINISRSGFKVECMARLNPDEPLNLTIKGLPAFTASIVWSNAGSYGCQFQTPLSAHQLHDVLARTRA